MSEAVSDHRAIQPDDRMSVYYREVRDFMVNVAGQDALAHPTVPGDDVLNLRATLTVEEVLETVIKGLGMDVVVIDRQEAVEAARLDPNYFSDGVKRFEVVFEKKRDVDLVEVADGAADINVVNLGMLIAFGIKDHALFKAVNAANLDKKRGHRREDGKWVKPDDWTPPDISGILGLTPMKNIIKVLGDLMEESVQRESDFRKELRELLNKHSRENGSNTPDHVLTEYLSASLAIFDGAIRKRQAWYGGQSAGEAPPVYSVLG